MIKIAHVARLAVGGKWQAYVEKPGTSVAAVFYGDTRQEAVKAAVEWAGDGDRLVALDRALDGLSEALEALRGK